MSEREPHKSERQLPLTLVAAIGRNRAIGRDGALPWHMPSDLAHFRERTMGRPMIMGRRTFESIGRALPGRESIVVTRDPAWQVPLGVHRAIDLESALNLAESHAAAMAAPAITVIGGATIFAALIGRADRLAMTFVDLAPDADTFFPEIDPAIWEVVARHVPLPHPEDETTCVFIDYARRDRQGRAFGADAGVL